jgi:hypothetical protein
MLDIIIITIIVIAFDHGIWAYIGGQYDITGALQHIIKIFTIFMLIR